MEEHLTKRAILAFAKERYGTEPEYLWFKYPNYAVLRRGDNQKWYGIIMDVPPEKLGLVGKAAVDILNVKCDPILIGSLRADPGFFPAYHMSKASWISILLDGTVPPAQLQNLLDLSYQLTGPKRK